ncbi:hypothetical protein [Lapillicoccus jejuensis]|uniref:Uncharacterized protein n=1 Tax=Lapillicoccus jejuensis TaxID=402171 RepID=A0A542DYZ6_9MICO|nr:hypothetical protein [Lapillicoccus jejuensis]TQJ08307.1 hypothetical protein FB458_1392 [Lapillicoccus jejuensis]
MTHPGSTRLATRPPAGHHAAVPPTVTDVRDGLEATLPADDFELVWAEVCARVGVPTTVSVLDDAQLDSLLTQVAAQGSLCRVLAMSWRIRATAARKLTQLGR